MIIEFDIPSPVNAKQLTIFVRALCAYDYLWLQSNPRTPDLYESGVRYSRQPGGVERFLPIPRILDAGEADCDQLAPWRAAELRLRYGIRAQPEVRKMAANLFHVFVRHPNGRVEDPSARLGMSIPRRLVLAGEKLLPKQQRKKPKNVPIRRVAVAGSWSAWAR